MHDVRISMPFLGSRLELHQLRLEKLRLPLDWRYSGMPAPGQEFAYIDHVQQEQEAMASFGSYASPWSDTRASSIADMSRLLYYTSKVPHLDMRKSNADLFRSQQRMLVVHLIARFIHTFSDTVIINHSIISTYINSDTDSISYATSNIR